MTEAIIKVTPGEWDAQYRAGQWDYLKGITAHYAVIASLIKKYECTSIIDAGCGEGALFQFLYPPARYTGLDVSRHAIRDALLHTDGLNVFGSTHAIDATTVSGAEVGFNQQKFDCSVFCESLYYMPDPLEVLARYFGFCKIIFVSIMVSGVTSELIHSIKERFTVVDDFQLSNGKGGSWEIMAVKP